MEARNAAISFRTSIACSCSAQRVQSMLTGLGRSEVEEVLNERGKMEVTCEFCGQMYVLTAEQCRMLFS